MSQRNLEDRRRLQRKQSFPFRDSNGAVVLEERRIQPDRRTNGVEEAEWSEIPEPSRNCQSR